MEGGMAKEFGTEKNDGNGNSEDLREAFSFVPEIQAEMGMQQNEPLEKRHKENWVLRKIKTIQLETKGEANGESGCGKVLLPVRGFAQSSKENFIRG